MAEAEKRLGYSPDGLSQLEAQKRLTQYGLNEIQVKKANPILRRSRPWFGRVRPRTPVGFIVVSRPEWFWYRTFWRAGKPGRHQKLIVIRSHGASFARTHGISLLLLRCAEPWPDFY
ncbi:MAG: cation-transporting P-type ATPase [Acidimicrobiales bacterium]